MTSKHVRFTDVKKCMRTCVTNFGVKIRPKSALNPKVRRYTTDLPMIARALT
jgi:hypothetical protein